MIWSSTENHLYVKRDDLYPLSFGGNKARKWRLFFREIDASNADCIVTYGSGSSNHCRVVANLAAMRGLPCIVVIPYETATVSTNSRMVRMMGAEYRACPLAKVSETIDQTLAELRAGGYHPYFIPGGGHGNLGTRAYVEAYREILQFEEENDIAFSHIFFASGTGTTQAGLVCGQRLYQRQNQEIVGISIARKNPRGQQIVLDSIESYLGTDAVKQDNVHFIDTYVDGYGQGNAAVSAIIRRELLQNALPLDATYTGKAFYGMECYIKENDIRGENILFLHTGGTPLFFDYLEQTP